ncbi:hypothetical protein RhiLY_08559 [Ceratobasidium sp. AG-Ba]|nr:hypothetical protein RhiLY_08559 [Ceratobasidium sp. AG-Ba]
MPDMTTQQPVPFTRFHPASEQELTVDEKREPCNVPRARVLARLQFQLDGQAVALPEEMVASGDFRGLSVTGITASLSAPDGLFAQCCWFVDDIDWFWLKITDIVKIERRNDSRFRGGTTCLWLTSHVAEYALASGHIDSEAEWECTLERYNAPRSDVWPRMGIRPDWWPDQWAKAWPYSCTPKEHYAIPTAEESLINITARLSLNSSSTAPDWRRLGPWADIVPGRPMHHLSQTTDWVLAPDGGIRMQRPQQPARGEELNADEPVLEEEIQSKRKRKRNRKGKNVVLPSEPTLKRQR